MRRKISKLLMFVTVLFGIGVGGAAYYMNHITDEMQYLIKLHEIEQLRRDLIHDVQNIQNRLYDFETGRAAGSPEETDMIFSDLRDRAGQCLSCHHPEALADRLRDMSMQIIKYESEVKAYIASDGRLSDGSSALQTGKHILAVAGRMSHVATSHLQEVTGHTLYSIGNVRSILFVTLACTFMIAILLAIRTGRSITGAMNKLLTATDRLASGNFGTTIDYDDKTELGKLAKNFNRMSVAVKESYDKVRLEIQERKHTEHALWESKERYKLAAQGANDGLWDWDIRTGQIYYSPRWKYMLGIPEPESAADVNVWLNRIHPDDRQKVQLEISGHIEGVTGHFASEHRLLHNDGTYRWMQFRGVAVRSASGDALRMAGSMTEITDRKEVEQRLVFEALHDALTELPNRALFMDRLKHALDQGRRSEQNLFAVLFIDLDRFKIVNDSMGHAAGDEMLMAVSGRLQECLRDCDTVSRFGGDEFAILLESLKNENEALHIVRRIQEKMSRSFSICGQDVFTSASIGIVFSSAEGDSAEILLRNADIAMYHAKAEGSNGYDVFNGEMYAEAVSRLEIETDLRVALKNGEFRLLYQPIISVSSGAVVGFESLLRWLHPMHGMIGPEHFMEIAEDTGFIVEIGEWVLAEACRSLSEWQRLYPSDPPLAMSINISSKQLFPGLLRKVYDALHRNSIRPGSLILELTESMMMENRDVIVPLLSELKNMSVKIHIDDFGTGYSSLSYLNDLPVDVLKIDKSFVSRIGLEGENMEIIRAITMLARSLGMGVIAEGVEAEEQIARLRSLGCSHMQGYYFSVPLEPEQAESLINTGNSLYDRAPIPVLKKSES